MNTSINSSSFADLSPPPHLSSSNISSYGITDMCLWTNTGMFFFLISSITNLLPFPVHIFVLCLGCQQWRKRRFVSTATASHSDILTFNSVAMHLMEISGRSLHILGIYKILPEMSYIGSWVSSATSCGQSLFQLLTCMGHYLAVVHPITYVRLRQRGGARIRNISIGCVWLLCVGYMSVYFVGSLLLNMILYIIVVASFLIIISFCSISVLCALKRPGPGEGGGNRERVDQSKQRAFHNIMAVMGLLFLQFGGNLIAAVVFSYVLVDMCVVMMFFMWTNLPSGLVLPFLFLRRAGKLPCCKYNAESG